LAVQYFQVSDDFFRRQLRIPSPLIQSAMSDDVVGREDSMRNTVLIDNREPSYLPNRHDAQGLLDFVFGLAGEHLCGSNLKDGELSRHLVSRSNGDANVAIRNDAAQFPISSDDWQHSTIVDPHEFDGGTDVGVRAATDYALRHDVFHFHSHCLTLLLVFVNSRETLF